MRKKKLEPSASLGYVPAGGETKRWEDCGRDISVTWVICALATMWPEERFHVWQFLRSDEALKAFRAAREKVDQLATRRRRRTTK